MLTKLFPITGSVCLLAVASVAVWIGWQVKLTNDQLRSAINETQWLVADARKVTQDAPKMIPQAVLDNVEQIVTDLRTTTQQAKFASFDARAALKAQREEWESPEFKRYRQETFRAGPEGAKAIAQLNEILTQVRSETLPATTTLLVTLNKQVESIGVSASATFVEIAKLVEKGELTFEAANKVLASPQWEEILKHIAGSTANIEATTAALPGTAAAIEKILQTSEKWQKPILLAGLLSTIARAFIP